MSRKHHDSRFVEKFDRIVPQELDRINFIVEELLSLARPARLQCAPVALSALLQRVVEIYSERLQQQSIQLKTDWAAALPPLLADVEQLHRCFTNIVLNAIEAMPTGGELSILCRPVPKALIDFTTTSNRGTSSDTPEGPPPALDLYATDVEVVIKDTGMGIPAAQVDQVFTPFWTTKPKGTGLGLALTHKIIEEHGGTIHLTSEVGQGTTVTIHLPTSASDSLSPARFHNAVPSFLGNDRCLWGCVYSPCPVALLLCPPPNLLISKSNQRGLGDCEKPATTGSWAHKMAPELHRYLRTARTSSENVKAARSNHVGLTHRRPLP